MSLPKRCVEMLIDLVDNKLTSMQVIDREDAREILVLEQCKRELQTIADASRRGSNIMHIAAANAAQPSPQHLRA